MSKAAITTASLLASAAPFLRAGENLIPNGTFDEVEPFAARLERANGLYYFDNVRVEEISPEEMAKLVEKRSGVK